MYYHNIITASIGMIESNFIEIPCILKWNIIIIYLYEVLSMNIISMYLIITHNRHQDLFQDSKHKTNTKFSKIFNRPLQFNIIFSWNIIENIQQPGYV